METWALYFFIHFATGHVFIMENNNKFFTKEECVQRGLEKGSFILQDIVMRMGVPAYGKFSCKDLGLET